jgi:hypothetical protein
VRFILFFFFFAVLGHELRAFAWSHSTSPIFTRGFFEMGSRELFAQALPLWLEGDKRGTPA